MLSQQPPLTMSFIKESFKFFCKFANLETGCLSLLGGVTLPKYSGYAMGYGLETIIGPIEITWSPKPKNGYTWFSVDYFKFNIYQYKS
jgi:NTE family protein